MFAAELKRMNSVWYDTYGNRIKRQIIMHPASAVQVLHSFHYLHHLYFQEVESGFVGHIWTVFTGVRQQMAQATRQWFH